MEGMADETGKPDNCVSPNRMRRTRPPPGGYAARLNPFVYFHSLLDLGDCAENDVPLTELEGDLKKVETTPNFSYISPNLCNAGVGGQCPAGAPEGAAAADAFLAQLGAEDPRLPRLQAGRAADRQLRPGRPGRARRPGRRRRRPATRRRSARCCSRASSPPAATDAAAYDPYSLLRTFEDLFGLSPLGRRGRHEGQVAVAPALEGANGGD